MSAPVCAVIAAWNQADKTLACLETVAAQTYRPARAILVDNASSDGTAERVAAAFPAVEIIRNRRNLGFAGGYNVGLRAALAGGCEFILLLNNDTLLAPDCLAALVAELDAGEDVGLVTAKIYYAADRDRIWSVGGRLHPWTLEVVGKGDGQIDRGQWAAGRDLDFAPLCGVLIRRALLDAIGLLDEAYFVYYEDMDFSRRARQAGFRLRLAPRAVMWHDVASSSGGRDSPAERYWMAQSSGRYFRTHGRGWRWLVIIPYRLASAVKLTLRLAGRGRWRAARAYWRGLLIGWQTGRAVTPPPDWVRQSG